MGKFLDIVLVWERPDGGVSVTHLHEDDMLPGETVDQFKVRYAEKLKRSPQFSALNPVTVERKHIPANKLDRECWSLKNGKVEVDQAKVASKNQKIARRNALLAKLKIDEDEAKLLKGI